MSDSLDGFLKKELEFQTMLNSGSAEYQEAYKELSASFAAIDDQLRDLDRHPDELVPARQVTQAIRAVMNFSTAMAQVQALAVNDDVVAMRQYIERMGHDMGRLLAWAAAVSEAQAEAGNNTGTEPESTDPPAGK